MRKLFLALMARALAAESEREFCDLYKDVEVHYMNGKLGKVEYDLLNKLIERLF